MFLVSDGGSQKSPKSSSKLPRPTEKKQADSTKDIKDKGTKETPKKSTVKKIVGNKTIKKGIIPGFLMEFVTLHQLI